MLKTSKIPRLLRSFHGY